MLDITVTARAIKNAREKAGMTQEELAKRVFVTKQAVSNWERGKNLPDEVARDDIERALGIKLHKEYMNSTVETESFSFPKLKPLTEIHELEDLLSQVDLVVKSITIDEYEHVVRKMLTMTLIEILGYEFYYLGLCSKCYSEVPLDWDSTAEDLESLIKDDETWLIEDAMYPNTGKRVLGDKIGCIAFQIGGELFEDFDEDGYRNGFEQQIGRLAQERGYDLLNLLPSRDTDILMIYKAAVYDMINICSLQC
jgi:transcriptional regulator with XRE-family HTH domain